MNTKTKKGFTLTELIIVIVIIGILAAVLIPTLTACVKKAKISNDKQLVRNLNLALSTDSLANHDGAKHQNMTEALKAAKDAGYLVGKINATKADNEILWDSKHDVFCYLNGTEVEYIPASIPDNDELDAVSDAHLLWQIIDVDSENLVNNSKYRFSVYASSTTVSEVTTDKGFDAGEQTFTKINYTRTGSDSHVVVVRTNGGILTVNAPSDDVHHYGYAEKVDVKDVKATSYHENGDVDLIKVQKGHVELEAAAQVLGVYVYTEDASAGFEDIKITVNQGAEIPQLSRSAVVINDEGTKVCTVVTDQAKDIYLFNEGIYEQIKAIDHIDPETTNYAQVVATALAESKWVDETDSGASENTQNAAWQLANEYNGRNSDGSISAETITIEETTYKVMLDNETRTFETFKQVITTDPVTNEEVVTDVKMTSSEIAVVDGLTAAVSEKKEAIQTNVNQSGSSEDDAVADLPLRGDGLSWETAFEIYDYATMQKINDYANLGTRYYKVVIEKTNNGHIDCSDWNIVYLNGSFDGNGVILDDLDYFLFQTLSGQENVLVKNITINANINRGDASNRAAAVLRHAAKVTRLENITIHGYITSSYAAAFIGWTRAGSDCTLYIDNCYGDAELAGTSASAVLFAHAYTQSGVDNRYIYMTDTLYEGIMSGTYHSFVTACSGGGAKNKEMYVTFNDSSMLSRFRNVCIAILAENTNGNGYQYQWCPGTDILNQSGYGANDTITGVMGMKNYVRTSAIEVIYHNGSNLTPGELVSIAKNASASTWSARFEIGPNDKNGFGNYVSAYVGPSSLTNNNGTLTTTNIYACTVTVNGDATESTGYTSDYTKFNVVNNIYGTTFGSASITITQYDSNGRLVQMDVWDLTK